MFQPIANNKRGNIECQTRNSRIEPKGLQSGIIISEQVASFRQRYSVLAIFLRDGIAVVTNGIIEIIF